MTGISEEDWVSSILPRSRNNRKRKVPHMTLRPYEVTNQRGEGQGSDGKVDTESTLITVNGLLYG